MPNCYSQTKMSVQVSVLWQSNRTGTLPNFAPQRGSFVNREEGIVHVHANMMTLTQRRPHHLPLGPAKLHVPQLGLHLNILSLCVCRVLFYTLDCAGLERKGHIPGGSTKPSNPGPHSKNGSRTHTVPLIPSHTSSSASSQCPHASMHCSGMRSGTNYLLASRPRSPIAVMRPLLSEIFILDLCIRWVLNCVTV